MDSDRRRLGICIGVPLPSLTPRGFADTLDLAVLADQLGFAEIATGEHLLISEDLDAEAGRYRWPLDAPWPEPFMVMAALASRTSRVRLVTDVVIAPLRPAVVLAKLAATLDWLSGGRLELGVGSGWQEHEYRSVGVPFAGRVKRMEEAVLACRALWGGGRAAFQSETVAFENAWSSPFPVQPGGPPVFIAGGSSEPVAARVARLADGWTTVPRPDEEIARGVELCRKAFAAAGRDPDALRVRINAWNNREAATEPDLEAVFAKVERYWTMGVTNVNLIVADVARTPAEAEAVLREASARFNLRGAAV